MNAVALRRRAQVLKAMGHPSRLAIVDAIGTGERCVGDLQAIVGSDISTVSRHLSVLRNAGIVADRKQGAQVFYSLRVPCLLRLFDCVDAVLEDSPDGCSRLEACLVETR